MSKELIERLREAAAQRVASTAMIGADDLIAAADALESLGADRDSWERQAGDRLDDVLRVVAERDALAAELKALREQAPVAVYKGHRHVPSDTKEFWGMADNHLSAGTHLYAHHVPACELTTSAIRELWSEADNINDFGYAIERYLKGEGK